MKSAKTVLLLMMAAAVLVPGLSGTALAFHDGGVGECEACHTMHNSVLMNYSGTANPKITNVVTFGGYATITIPAATQGTAANQYLLKGTDPSSTCLYCHGYGGGVGPAVYTEPNFSGTAIAITPGGDFGWTQVDYVYSGSYSWGDNHGHTVVAADFSMYASPNMTVAPGSTAMYPAANLACNSCHDPHGRKFGGSRLGQPATISSGSFGGYASQPGYGNYRLLGDTTYVPGDPSQFGVFSLAGFPIQTLTFVANAPMASVANNTGDITSYSSPYPNATLGLPGTSNYTVYGYGMSEWCGNCHDLFLNTSNTTTNHRHPAGVGATLSPLIYTYYNEYFGTGLVNTLDSATQNYWEMVPFEVGSAAWSGLTNGAMITAAAGPAATATSNVLCLSCHRAHASAFDYLARWDLNPEFMSSSGITVAAVNGTGTTNFFVDTTHTDTGSGSSPSNTGFVNSINAYYGVISWPFAQRQVCNKCHIQD